MKLIPFISFLFLSSFFVGVALEYYNIDGIQLCLTDFKTEGNSEKDSSENAEEDAETYSLNLLELPQLLFKDVELNAFGKASIIGCFMEIPNPPPEEA